MARRIADWTSDVLLVGYLPFMGKLVARLVVGDERRLVAAFVPRTVVWAITWMVRPELAPFPD